MITTSRVTGLIVTRDLLVGVVLFLILDALIFRTEFYRSRLAPLSYAGWVNELVDRTKAQDTTHTSNVVVLGDSRVAEGFSAKIGDHMFGEDGVKFLNVGIPGSSMRVWYYMLRELDPDRQNYNVIFLPLNDQFDGNEDRNLDLQFLTPLTRYEDILDLPWGFTTRENRIDAAISCILKGYAYRRDFLDFLSNRDDREAKVLEWHLTRGQAEYDYAGNPGSLTGLTVDATTGEPVYPHDFTPEQIASVELSRPKPGTRNNYVSNYAATWINKIRARYAGTATRIVIGRLPRGPIPQRSDVPDSATIEHLPVIPGVEVLSPDTFTDLELPDNFFDGLHMNIQGREAFSRRVASYLAPLAAPNAGRASWTWDDDLTARFRDSSLDDDGAVVRQRDKSGKPELSGALRIPLPRSAPPGKFQLQGTVSREATSQLPLTLRAVASTGEQTDLKIQKVGSFTLQLPLSNALTPLQSGTVMVELLPDATLSEPSADRLNAIAFTLNSVTYRVGISSPSNPTGEN